MQGYSNSLHYELIVIPYWLSTILFSILPACLILTFIHYRFWRRTEGTLCVACGYDLRATPEKCPECGTETAIHKPAGPKKFASQKLLGDIRKMLWVIPLFYLAGTYEMISFIENQYAQNADFFTPWGAAAMLVALAGAWHMGRYLRQPAFWFAFGCTGAILLLPFFMQRGFGKPGLLTDRTHIGIELILWMLFILSIGAASVFCASARRTRPTN